MKSIIATTFSLIYMFASLMPMANAGELSEKWLGTYSSSQTNFMTMKRLTFLKEKDGTVKAHGWLVGFPEEVSIGEAKPEPYADKNNKPNPDTAVASFSSEKYSPLLVLTPGGGDLKHFALMSFQCYMKDVDGSKIHFGGTLTRDPSP